MTRRRVATAGIALAIVALIAWLLNQTSRGNPDSAAPVRNVSQDAESDKGPARHAPPRRTNTTSAEDAAAAALDAALPEPVDLDKVDRDLDLHGVVVDATDHPVAGTRITTGTYPWRAGARPNMRDYDVEIAGPSTRSARDGTFAVHLTRGQSVFLRVAADGFARTEIPSVLAGERVRVTLRPGVRLVVAVADAAGVPVDGAIVGIYLAGSAAQIQVRTTAVGACTFENLPSAASIRIEAEHSRGLGEDARITLPETGEVRQEVRLEPGRTLRGRVVDAATKKPIEGARVGRGWVVRSPAITREDGTYELPGWTGKGSLDVHVLAEGYAREAKTIGYAERVDFELQRGYSTSGRIMDGDAHPVGCALVSLIGSEVIDPGARTPEQRFSMGFATTDAEGRFRVTGLRVGMRHVLVATATGHAKLLRETSVASSPADVDLGELTLATPHRIEGVVLDAAGAPVPRVRVVSVGPFAQKPPPYGTDRYGREETAWADDLGRFRFPDVAAGWYSVTASSPGTAGVRADVEVRPEEDLLELKLRREAAREVVVSLVNSKGSPVTDFYVNVTDRSHRRIQTPVDSNGIARLALPSASEGNHLDVFEFRDPQRFLRLAPRELRDEESTVKIVLVDAAEVTGRVVDPDGVPVVGANLRLEGPTESPFVPTTDDDGRFRIQVPREGRSTIVFDGSVRRGRLSEDSGFVARAEDVAPGSDIVLRCERGALNRRLVVLVLSPKEVPVAGVRVSLDGRMGQPATATTDAAGRAIFESLPAREVYVNVSPRDMQDFLPPASVQLVPDGRELRLVCRTASHIAGTIVDESGKALPQGVVSALRRGEWAGAAAVDAQGRFDVLVLVDDGSAVRLELDRDRDRRADASLDDVALGTTDVRIVVKK